MGKRIDKEKKNQLIKQDTGVRYVVFLSAIFKLEVKTVLMWTSASVPWEREDCRNQRG